jgi:hypothetical protein
MTDKRKIKVFSSFEEQDQYHLEQMKKTTVKERFIALFQMQKFTNAIRKNSSYKRTIVIHHGHPEQ